MDEDSKPDENNLFCLRNWGGKEGDWLAKFVTDSLELYNDL